MWDKLIMLIAFVATFLFWKATQKEHNKYKFYFKFFCFYLYGSFCAFFAWPLFLFNPKSVHNARFGAWLIKHITKLFEIEWVLRKGEILAEEKGAIVVSNHQSSLDLLGLFNIWHVVYKMTVITKKEIFYVWPFGLSAYLAGVVFINRANAKDAYKQLEITSNVLIKQKTKVWVFPEGTRNKDCTKMLPFKRGAFTMAVAAQVPIIPVVFSPYYFINQEKHIFGKDLSITSVKEENRALQCAPCNDKEEKHANARQSGHVIIQCLDPISTEGLSPEDIPELMNKVQQKIMTTYKELTKEVLEGLPPNYPFTTKG